jgi:hypothetical protein
MNEVLEIMTYVLIPLQKLLPDLDVTEKSRIEGVSSTVNVVEVRTRSLELPRVKSIEGEISGASSARGSSEIIERRARSNSTEILERRARSRSSTEKFDVTEWQSEVIENGKKGGLGVDAKQRGKPEYADRPRRRNQMPIIVRDVTKSRVYSNRVIGRDSEGKVIETVEF